MKSLYFVSARLGWQTVFGGHWYAETPKAAIEIAKSEINGNTTGIGLSSDLGLEFQARKSKSFHNALNTP